MSQPTNTFDAYDAVGQRESLSDLISNISPTECPFYQMAKKGKAKAIKEDWQLDSLAAADTNNAVIEGDDATLDASTATTRVDNYCQISDKTAVVSGTVEAVSKAGRAREMAYQVAKKVLELKRDCEAILLTNQAKTAGVKDTTARKLGSVLSWIATNTNHAGDGADPTGDGSDTRTDGTQRDFTEAMLKNVMQSCWTQGGNPSVLMVGGHNKQVISGFDGGNTRFDKSEDKKVVATVDIYEGDFHTLKVVPNRFMRARDALVLDKDFWEIAYLRPVRRYPLSKTGDSEKVQILKEYTLISRNEAASGGIFDLTTS